MERGTEPEPCTRSRQRLSGQVTSGSTEGGSPKLGHDTALGEGGEGKPMRNFPAGKPLKYHKTAKYSGADAVMRTPSAGSPR